MNMSLFQSILIWQLYYKERKNKQNIRIHKRWHLLKIFVNFVKTSLRRKSEENRVLMMPGLTNDFWGKWKSINDFWLDSAHYECVCGVNIGVFLLNRCASTSLALRRPKECIYWLDHVNSCKIIAKEIEPRVWWNVGRYELIFAPSYPLPSLVFSFQFDIRE